MYNNMCRQGQAPVGLLHLQLRGSGVLQTKEVLSPSSKRSPGVPCVHLSPTRTAATCDNTSHSGDGGNSYSTSSVSNNSTSSTSTRNHYRFHFRHPWRRNQQGEADAGGKHATTNSWLHRRRQSPELEKAVKESQEQLELQTEQTQVAEEEDEEQHLVRETQEMLHLLLDLSMEPGVDNAACYRAIEHYAVIRSELDRLSAEAAELRRDATARNKKQMQPLRVPSAKHVQTVLKSEMRHAISSIEKLRKEKLLCLDKLHEAQEQQQQIQQSLEKGLKSTALADTPEKVEPDHHCHHCDHLLSPTRSVEVTVVETDCESEASPRRFFQQDVGGPASTAPTLPDIAPFPQYLNCPLGIPSSEVSSGISVYSPLLGPMGMDPLDDEMAATEAWYKTKIQEKEQEMARFQERAVDEKMQLVATYEAKLSKETDSLKKMLAAETLEKQNLMSQLENMRIQMRSESIEKTKLLQEVGELKSRLAWKKEEDDCGFEGSDASSFEANALDTFSWPQKPTGLWPGVPATVSRMSLPVGNDPPASSNDGTTVQAPLRRNTIAAPASKGIGWFSFPQAPSQP